MEKTVKDHSIMVYGNVVLWSMIRYYGSGSHPRSLVLQTNLKRRSIFLPNSKSNNRRIIK